MKLYPVRLLQTAMTGAKPRSPAEGTQMVTKPGRARLVEVRQAENAADDVDTDDEAGDGLDRQTVDKLRKLAGDEGAEVDAKAKKAAVLAAIRERRALFDGTGVEVGPDDDLRKIVADEEIDVAEDADTAALLAAIAQARAAEA